MIRKFSIALLLLFAFAAPSVRAQEAPKPLNKSQVLELVKAGMDSAELAEKVKKLGIDFDLTDDYLESLRQAGAQDVLIYALRAARPKPLTRDQVLELVAGQVPSQHAATLVQQHGIDFLPDEEYLQTLKVAGAEEVLLTALKEAGAAVKATLLVTTSPDAEVFLDGESQGRAGAQGELAVKAKLGAHALKVSLPGKKDFAQNVMLAAPETNKVDARLEDLPGTIVVRTSPGASVFLDESSLGTADAAGQLSVPNVAAGSHELRIAASGKKEYRQNLTAPAGQVAAVEAPLPDVAATVAVQTSPEETADFNTMKTETDPNQAILRAEAFAQKYPHSDFLSYA